MSSIAANEPQYGSGQQQVQERREVNGPVQTDQADQGRSSEETSDRGPDRVHKIIGRHVAQQVAIETLQGLDRDGKGRSHQSRRKQQEAKYADRGQPIVGACGQRAEPSNQRNTRDSEQTNPEFDRHIGDQRSSSFAPAKLSPEKAAEAKPEQEGANDDCRRDRADAVKQSEQPLPGHLIEQRRHSGSQKKQAEQRPYLQSV